MPAVSHWWISRLGLATSSIDGYRSFMRSRRSPSLDSGRHGDSDCVANHVDERQLSLLQTHIRAVLVPVALALAVSPAYHDGDFAERCTTHFPAFCLPSASSARPRSFCARRLTSCGVVDAQGFRDGVIVGCGLESNR